MVTKIYAILMTVAFAVVLLFHANNPYPLVQIPDRGHRLYVAPAGYHETMVELLRRGGLKPYGTFRAGVRQTLFMDGVTVVASGPDLQKAAISIPRDDPEFAAENARTFLVERGIGAIIWHPSEPELEGKLVVVKLPNEFGWDLAFRLPGRKMPSPKWEQ